VFATSRTSRSLALAVVLATVVGGGRARAGAIFDFKVERFELDRAGVAPFVDDFGTDSGQWIQYFGTSVIVDGLLHLTSPGSVLPNAFGVLPGTTLDISAVLTAQMLEAGGGSFTAQSYWEPAPLVFGDFNHMSLLGQDGTTSEVLGVALTNPTPPGQPVRYEIDQHLVGVGARIVSHFDKFRSIRRRSRARSSSRWPTTTAAGPFRRQ